jgi:SAM-dependent methyltransferase
MEDLRTRAVADIAAAWSGALCLIGDRLGLYKSLAKEGPATSEELADRTGTSERYVREWLLNQASGGYVTRDCESGCFYLTPEQETALADESGSYFLHGAFDILTAVVKSVDRVERAFMTGEGIPWGDFDPALFRGTERFHRASYQQHLATSWLPSLDGVVDRLKRGALVADVGCGHGAATILMAKTFPDSLFLGFDSHPASVESARRAARRAGVTSNTSFVVADATSFPKHGFDLVACFDCLHEVGDPTGAARHIRSSLRGDGTWMIVEPFAHDDCAANFTPVGRAFYAMSTMICVPASLAQKGPALGAQAGESRLRSVVQEGGFSRFRRVAETPFSIVLEARH